MRARNSKVSSLVRAGQRSRLSGDVPDPLVGGNGIAPGIDPEQRRPSGAWTMKAEQKTDRGRLPCAVRAEVAVDLTRLDNEIQRSSARVSP